MKDIRNISELHNWEKNPRSIKDKDFKRLKKQIQQLGQYKPLLITEDGTVLGGNMRLRAYKELGIIDVWVSIVSAETEAQKLAYALSDNDRAGYYDDDLLANLIPDYPDFQWSDYAVDMKEPQNLQELIDRFTPVVEDEVPEVPKDAISKLGEVYQLGRHRLMCGDATKIEDVEKLMNGQKADMVFTDPPYGVDFSGQKFNPRAKDWDGIKNDTKQGEELREFIKKCFSNIITFSKEATPLYSWAAPMNEGYAVLQGLKDCGIHIQAQLIWYKNTIVLGQADYQWRHEICWYGWTPGKNHFWNGGRSLSTVWEYSKDSNQSYQHPMQKPVKLASTAINNSCREDGLVIDLFGGSGSTLIACEQTNRTCYMMEIDPRYIDVIRKRYENYIHSKKEQI